jgi:hypothetical protein
MKKIAAALVALVVTMAGLTGAAVSTSTAAQEHPTTHTKRLVLHEIAGAGLGPRSFAATARIRSRATNDVLGFASYTAVFNRRTERVRIWASLALRGGLIHLRVTLTEEEDRFTGRITGGAGKYRGITGTFTGREASGNRTFLNLHYALPG